MGVELMEIGVKVRKVVIFTIRGCVRSAWNHPFLVGVLCFLIFLYRLSPFVFQILVSASPVLVCTAILLGTILSFGQPNIPEIEVEEEETTVDVASIKTGVLGETAVVEEKNESYYVERFSERSRDEREETDGTTPLIEERSVETEVNDGEIGEGRRELGDLVYEQKADWIEERLRNVEILENHFAEAGRVNDESDDVKSEADSFGSEKVNVDSLDSPPHSPWTRVEEREDEDDDGSDSESSQAESSSPDASMADILPMLDELHPLLDEEAPLIVREPHDDFDGASEKSGRSGTSGHESDGSENREDVEGADDDNEDEEDEEGKKEEERKSVIAWTEEDQKNLMDLGSSEIERNQRLENLILRRRARKMFADKNLIDLDSADLPFDIAPISTRRHNNPFDHAHDYYDNNLGLPPIPGSAPSVLLQRRNPFDIPYDSSEEKPDLMGDGFKEEFATTQPREPFFRRHESFNVGPSNFAPKRKMRPFFVPEGEESSSSIFQRQSSEVSGSKMSSVPDTESISSVTSVEDIEDRKLPEEENFSEVEMIVETKEEGPSGDSEPIYVELEENVHQEPEMISVMECVSEHFGHGSESSSSSSSSSSEEEDSFELGEVENRDVEFIELESRLEDVADDSDSSSSSLSEVSERVFTMTEGEGDVAEEPHISNETSAESTNLNISNLLVNDVLHRGPVYDTSPRELSNNVPSSISCDVLPESDLGSFPVVDRTTVSYIERESEGSSLAIPDPSADESRSFDDSTKVQDHINTDFSAVDGRSIGEGSSASADIAHDKASVEEHFMEQHIWDEVPVSSADITMVKSSEDQNLERPVEDLYSLLAGDSPLEVNEPPSEGQPSVVAEETALRELNFTHLNEVEASSTPTESFVDDRVRQKSNVPEVEELDHFILSNINSPSSPEFVAIPPNAFEATTSLIDEQIIVEQVDEIKDIDDMLLSELDSVGDFSVNQLGSDSSHFDKHIDSVAEGNFSSLHETSPMRYFDVDSVELNRIEATLHSNNSREHADMYEGDVERISELQTSETRREENIEASRMEFNENDRQDSPYQETPGQQTRPMENHDYEDTFTTVSRLEVGPVEDVDAIPLENAELMSVVPEIIEGGAEVSTQGQVDNDTVAAMPEVEASTIEDIDLAFKQISSGEIEESIVLKPTPEFTLPESEVQSTQDVDAATEIPTGMLSLEANKIEDIALAFEQISANEIEKPAVLEPPQAELHNAIPESEMQSRAEVDTVSERAELTFVGTEIMSDQGQFDTETVSGMPELAASTISDIDLAFNQISSKEIEKPELEVQSTEHVDVVLEKAERQVDTDTSSGMTELEASTIEDINLAFEEISSKEVEKTVVLEPHNHEDTVSGILDQSTEHVDGVLKQAELTSAAAENFTELKIEDIDMAFEQISSKEIEKPEAELAVGETASENSNVTESVREVGPIKDATLDHVIESGETQEALSKLHVAESIPSEDTISSPKQVLDGETMKRDDGSVEVEADKLGPSEEKSQSSGKEGSYVAEKAERECTSTEDLHSPSSAKGKGKVSKSSSSSSESSSSDSDKE